MKKIVSLFLCFSVILIVVPGLSSCSLLTPWKNLEGEDFYEYYSGKSAEYYSDSIKSAGNIHMSLGYKDASGKSVETTIDSETKTVYLDFDGKTPYHLVDIYFESDESRDYRVRGGFYDGKAFYAYESDIYYNRYYSVCSKDEYSDQQIAFTNSLSGYDITGWAENFEIQDRDEEGTITFKYSGLKEDCHSGFADFMIRIAGLDGWNYIIEEYEIISVFDEKSFVQIGESFTVKGECMSLNQNYKFEYSLDNEIMLPQEEDMPGEDFFLGYGRRNAVHLMDACLDEFLNLIYPSRMSAGISYDITQKIRATVSKSSGSQVVNETITQTVEHGYDQSAENVYYYKSNAKNDDDVLSQSFSKGYLTVYSNGKYMGKEKYQPEAVRALNHVNLASLQFDKKYVTSANWYWMNGQPVYVKYYLNNADMYADQFGFKSHTLDSCYVRFDFDNEGNVVSMKYYVDISGTMSNNSSLSISVELTVELTVDNINDVIIGEDAK